jgi:hypothetical protein
MIQQDFKRWALTWPGYGPTDVRAPYSIPRASKYNPAGDKLEFERHEYDDITLLIPSESSSRNRGEIDIADLRAREIYEIKHYKSEKYGRNELWWYLSFLPGYGPGSRQYPTGIRRIGDWPAPYNRTYDVVAWIDNGVILYKGRYKGQNIKDLVTAVCAVAVAGVAGKKLIDTIRGRPRPSPPPVPGIPQPAFEQPFIPNFADPGIALPDEFSEPNLLEPSLEQPLAPDFTHPSSAGLIG